MKRLVDAPHAIEALAGVDGEPEVGEIPVGLDAAEAETLWMRAQEGSDMLAVRAGPRLLAVRGRVERGGRHHLDVETHRVGTAQMLVV